MSIFCENFRNILIQSFCLLVLRTILRLKKVKKSLARKDKRQYSNPPGNGEQGPLWELSGISSVFNV